MSTPSSGSGGGAQHVSAVASADNDGDATTDIPRRLMRVKVLYTFDDQNKSNCLARLPNALSIPAVSLDETTQVGVIELKTCIQAIVAASPELVAKLGHDYTVYAYDFSEYETPLVGQGMLSWILASASATPNAPAEQSQTMVTGRVCKNILGLFSNGVKETLEVKLKLVPVPTCMQSEYVQNMERYHNLSKVMPEGLSDYNAWAEFLKANPAISQLAQPAPGSHAAPPGRNQVGGVESFHEMLTRPSPPEETMRNDSFYDHRTPFNTYDTRASSPAMSTASFNPYQFPQDSRPASRASFYSESAAPLHQYPIPVNVSQEQQEEGPPKKRARITKAKRPKKTTLSANNDSLRMTASTAASVRLHRPVAAHAGAAVSVEQVPRAPTPRPGNPALPHPCGPARPPAPSLLRHASMDETLPYVSPYDSNLFSDAAVDSADDERVGSPSETPQNIPSSPPVMPQPLASSAPSSPELPSLSFPTDSGFVSDMPVGCDDEGSRATQSWNRSDVITAPEATVRIKKKVDNSKRPWTEINPGPIELLPTSAFPLPPTDTVPFSQPPQAQSLAPSPQSDANAGSPDTGCPPAATANTTARSSTPNPPNTKPTKTQKGRGLPRSHTWSGEPISDAAIPVEGSSQQPRSGSGAKRRHVIRERLQKALVAGEMPTYCNNCGQIDTPVWRKAYTRVETGSTEGIVVSTKETGITAFEAMEPNEDGVQQYRVFKQDLDQEETESQTFTKLTLCNPCGLWLYKKNAMRPHDIWAKTQAANNGEKPKRKRNRKKTKTEQDGMMSDAVVPESEPVVPDTQEEAARPRVDGAVDDTLIDPALRECSSNVQGTESTHLDEAAAQAALMRAIDSSPVGLRGTRNSPIDIEADLTPKPTRRLLFPSPRKLGEVKSLGDSSTVQSPTARANRSKAAQATAGLPGLGVEDVDKENCPPPVDSRDDGLGHLFEDNVLTKTTPTKSRPFEDLLKTPTPPSSHRRGPLTPRRGAELGEARTPSRVMKTPRTGGRATTVAPETPFTRQLNNLLSDMASSPSQAFDFSAFPTFNTPGQNNVPFSDFLPDDFLSSDLPIPSSPPKLDFSVFEDPSTSTVGLWSGASIFEAGDTIMPEAHSTEDNESNEESQGTETTVAIKIEGIGVDFAAMIEDVVGSANKAANIQSRNSEDRDKSPALEANSSKDQGEKTDGRPQSVEQT